MSVGPGEIRHRFGHHPVTAALKQQHEKNQAAYIAFAEFLDSVLPDGRAKSTAFTKLQESFFWAEFAIDASMPTRSSNQAKEKRQNGRGERPASAGLSEPE